MKHMKNIALAGLLASASYTSFLAKAEAVGFDYGKKDGEPTLTEIKTAQDNLIKGFEDFKAKNDERLAEIEKKGAADPLLTEQVEKMNAELDGFKDIRDQLNELSKKAARPNPAGNGEQKQFSPEQIEHKDAFENFVRKPNDQKALGDLQAAETKAVDGVDGASGGHAVPEMISSRIERNLPEISPLRNLVDVQQAGTKDFKMLVDVRGASYGWVGETAARTEKDTPGLEEVAPTFGTLYAYPKATEESLDDLFFNVEDWIINSALEAFAEGEENAIINGNGANKPTGILNGNSVATGDASRSFGVLQHVNSGAAADFAADDPADKLLAMIYALKKGYRSNSNFLMNRATAGKVRMFKDGQGNYLWQPATVAGQPDMLHGYSVAESEEMPDVAANATPIAFGDFKAGYALIDLVGLRLTKDEITTPGYVKYYIRRRMGGKIKKSEAIKLLKIAA